MKKKSLMDEFPILLSVYISEKQMKYIDTKGKRSAVIRELIDEKIKG